MKNNRLTKKERLAIIIGIAALVIGFFSYLTFAGTTVGLSLQQIGIFPGGPNINSGMVGHWTFDSTNMTQNIADTSGNGNDMLLRNFINYQNKTGTTTIPGPLGQALLLNRNGASFTNIMYAEQTSNAANLKMSGSFSISFWMKPTPAFSLILSREATNGNFGYYLAYDLGAVSFVTSQNGTGIAATRLSSVLNANTWNHVVAQYDSSAQTMNIYLNGVLANGSLTGTVPSSIYNTFNLGLIVGASPASSQFYMGALDDVRIYNRTLSTAEITRLYSLGSGTHTDTSVEMSGTLPGAPNPNSGMVGYWTFDGVNMKQNVADSSGRGNNGIIFQSGLSLATTSFVVPGKIGQGFRNYHLSSGAANSITMGNASDFNFGVATPFSIASWVSVTPDDTAFSQIIIAGKSACGAAYFDFGWDNGHAISTNALYVQFGGSTSGSMSVAAPNNSLLPDNTWHYAVMTYDGSNSANGIKIYLDGALESTSVINNNLVGDFTNSAAFELGYDGGCGRALDGRFDDTRVYNRAITAAEVQRLYQLGVPPNVGGTSAAPTFGETSILPSSDSGNGDFLLAQQATLSTAGVLQSLSFYVGTAVGDLRLGIYDATGPAGQPGGKLAETAAFTPIVGWNTVPVISQVALPAGTYWLAHNPQSNSLTYRHNNATGSICYYSSPYGGTLPSTFNTSPSCFSGDHWSMYGTLAGVVSQQSIQIGGGLVGYWPFDGKYMFNLIGDASGNGNDMIYSGTSGGHATTTIPGKVGQAIVFNARGVPISLNNDWAWQISNSSTLLFSGSASVSYWMKPNLAGGLGHYPIVNHTDGHGTCSYDSGLDDPVNPEILYFKISKTGTCSTGANAAIRYGTTQIQSGKWYHVVDVYDSSAQTMHVYVNGVLDDGTLSGTIPSSMNNSELDGLFLGFENASGLYYMGALDDVRIYNRALSASEAQRLYQLGK